jgi:hypothetical protein
MLMWICCLVARAQGFPESFVLDCCLNQNRIYSLLGNAVPPPLASAVCGSLLVALGLIELNVVCQVTDRLARDVLVNEFVVEGVVECDEINDDDDDDDGEGDD